MTRFKNILLVFGGNDNDKESLNRAFTLAKSNKAKLTIADVSESVPDKVGEYVDIVSVHDFEKIITEEKVSKIRSLVKRFESRMKLGADVKVLVGKPHIEIIREVLRNGHDLVMKTAEGKGGTKEMLFGSVDVNLMRKCPCPVWMIKPSRSRKYSRILAAVDPDPYDEKTNRLNDVIMELALSLSILEKSELHVVHVWSLFGESTLRGPRFRKTESQMRKLVRDAKKTHKKWLDKMLQKITFGEKKPKIHLIKGDPTTALPRFARRQKIDLIVMGTLCRTGLPGFLIGNTAESAINQANCSVLTVKPEGFISPVTI